MASLAKEFACSQPELVLVGVPDGADQELLAPVPLLSKKLVPLRLKVQELMALCHAVVLHPGLPHCSCFAAVLDCGLGLN